MKNNKWTVFSESAGGFLYSGESEKVARDLFQALVDKGGNGYVALAVDGENVDYVLF